jgi:hypothetical protein
MRTMRSVTVTLNPALATFLTKVAPDLVGALSVYVAAAAPNLAFELVLILTKWQEEARTAFARKECELEGGWKSTTQQAKEDSGALLSFRDGKKVLISANSFHRHLAERFMLSHPLNGPPKRGRYYPPKRQGNRTPDAISGI